MEFFTISQYFNKLQIALFLLLIMSLLAFSAVYLAVGGMPPDPRPEYLIAIPGAAVLDWCAAMIIFSKKIKSLRHQQGLGAKLEKYFRLTIVRYAILSSANLLLAGGLYLTRSDVFTGFFAGGLVLSAILWPTSQKVTRDLRLKGDEREMVLFRKDTL